VTATSIELFIHFIMSDCLLLTLLYKYMVMMVWWWWWQSVGRSPLVRLVVDLLYNKLYSITKSTTNPQQIEQLYNKSATNQQPGVEWVQALTDNSRLRNIATATQPVHRLQIRPVVHHSLSYIRVRAIVWACGRGQTDTQTRVTTIHFASSTTHAKCNESTV